MYIVVLISFLLYSRNSGILWIMHGHCPRPRRFSCVQPTGHISFWISLNFAGGLLCQRSGHPVILVAQELKLCSGESKMSKVLTIACVQAIGHSFFHIYLYLVHKLVGMMSRHPIFFVGLVSKSSE